MRIRAKNEVLFCEKATEIYIYFIIIVLSIFCYPSYSNITEWKFKLFFLSTVIYAAVLLIGNLELYLVGNKTDLLTGIKKLKQMPMVALGLYLLFCFVSFLLSEHKSLSFTGAGKFDGLASILLYVFAFAAIICFGRFKIEYAFSFIPVIFLNFILVIAQFFGGNPFGLYPEGMDYHDAFVLYSNEFLGTFGNVDILSAFLSMSIPLFTALAIRSEGKSRLLFFVSLFPASFMLFICKVYSGMVGTAAAIILLAFFIGEKKEFRSFMISLAIIVSAASFALFMLDIFSITASISVFILFIGLCFVKRFTRNVFLPLFLTASALSVIFFFLMILNSENSDSGRLRIWKDALRIFIEHPIFGSGPGTFIEEVSFQFERYSEELDIMIKSSIDCAHNVYLNILASTGIASLSAFVFFIISLIKGSHKSFLIFPIVSFLVCSFFSFVVCSVSAVFYIICGLAVCDKTIINQK